MENKALVHNRLSDLVYWIPSHFESNFLNAMSYIELRLFFDHRSRDVNEIALHTSGDPPMCAMCFDICFLNLSEQDLKSNCKWLIFSRWNRFPICYRDFPRQNTWKFFINFWLKIQNFNEFSILNISMVAMKSFENDSIKKSRLKCWGHS